MCKKNLLLIAASSLLLLAMMFHSPIGTRFNLQIVKPVGASPNTIIVPTNFSTIQEAINAANSGDTILVRPEMYYEHIVVNKTVSLIGENPATTIIDGSGIGIVVRIRASNVTIRGFTIQNGGDTLSGCGIYMTNHTEKIRNNLIRNNYNGIWLQQSNGSNIIGNTIWNNTWALHISESNENIIHGNTIANNSIGAWIPSSAIPNTFYRNNFIDNAIQGSDFGPSKWDNGTEGNYWSDYTGVDTDGDGIGNTKTPHLGLDQYPLIIPTRPFPVVWDDIIYPVALLSNSTVSRFYFSKPLKRIGFNVTGSSDTTGFCNVTIPLTLMWCDQPEEWQVTVGGDSPAYFPTPTDNETHTFLYFAYNHGTHNVEITSIHVVPEFPAAIFSPLFIIVTLAVVVLRKRKKGTSEY